MTSANWSVVCPLVELKCAPRFSCWKVSKAWKGVNVHKHWHSVDIYAPRAKFTLTILQNTKSWRGEKKKRRRGAENNTDLNEQNSVNQFSASVIFGALNVQVTKAFLRATQQKEERECFLYPLHLLLSLRRDSLLYEVLSPSRSYLLFI